MARINFPAGSADNSPFEANGITYTWNENGTEEGFWEAGSGAIDLDAVCDAGNTTDKGATFGSTLQVGTGIDLETDGSAEFADEIVVDGVNIGGAGGTGANNTRCGPSALNDLTEGAQNTAVGSAALLENETGNDNTAVGRNSLASTVSGSSNSGFGANALGNVTGDRNVGIGHNSGSSLTDGDNNTIIGSLAGTAGMANTMLFGTGTTERFRIDPNHGAMLIGTTQRRNLGSSGNQHLIQQESANSEPWPGINLTWNTTGVTGPAINFGKSNGSYVGDNDALPNGHEIGGIFWYAADGTDMHTSGANIRAVTEAATTGDAVTCGLRFSTNAGANGATERIRIDHDGRMILMSSPGIQFGQNNTGTNITSQTLDDYEEGTWVPRFYGNANGATTQVLNAIYTKVGRLVTCAAHVRLTSKGTNAAGSNLSLSNLPFSTPANNYHGHVGISFFQGFSTNISSLLATVQPSSSNIIFRAVKGTEALVATTVETSEVNAGDAGLILIFTANYMADD